MTILAAKPTGHSGSALSITQQRICAYGGIAWLVFLFAGLICAGWLPPPDPDMTAADVALMYVEHGTRIRVGSVLIGVGGCLQGLLVTAIGVQLARIEGRRTPMAWVQVGFGYVAVLMFMIPPICWETAAYRPERDPEITQLLHEFGWIPFVSAVIPAVLQNLAIAVTVFRQRVPVYPRWLGYLNIYCAILYLPSTCVMFFHRGPLAWDGLIAFWVLTVDFTIWVIVMIVLTLRAIGAENEPEEVDARTPGRGDAPGIG